MIFKSDEELKSFLMAKCQSAIAITQDNVRQDIKTLADNFYNDYDPVVYERTGQLNSDNFIQKSPIDAFGNECRASVYLDVNSLNYVTGRQPSGAQVVSAAVQGGHGATGLKVVSGNGARLWDEQLQSRAMNSLISELMAQGIPIA